MMKKNYMFYFPHTIFFNCSNIQTHVQNTISSGMSRVEHLSQNNMTLLNGHLFKTFISKQ